MAKLLIVDDEKPVRGILSRMLSEAGHEVCEAEDSEHARIVLKQHEFEAVFCDVEMPGESGVDLVAFIVQEYPDTAVIMATILNDAKIVDRVLKLGVYGYIVKPLDKNQVQIVLANALHRRELEINNRRQQENLERLVAERTSELHTTIEQLKTVEQFLREREEKFRTISTYAKDGIVMIDEDDTVAYWNSAAEKIFGYSEQEIIGRKLHDFIVPEQYVAASQEGFKKFRRKGSGDALGQILELKAYRKDRSIFPVELSISATKYHEKWMAIGIIRDITRRKEIEEEEKRMATYATLINEISQRVSSKLNLNEFLNETVSAILDAFHYYGVMILLTDQNGKSLQLKAIAGGYTAIFPDDLSFSLDEGMIGYCAVSGKIESTGDVSKNSHFIQKADEKTKSELDVPIKRKNRVLGVLDIQSDRYHAFGELDVTAMKTLANQIAIGIDNSMLYEKMRREIRERQQAEKALSQEQRLLHLFIENLPEAIYFKDTAGRFLQINQAQAKRLGLQYPGDAVDKTDFDFFDREVARQVYEEDREIMKSGDVKIDEKEKMYPDGRTRWITTTRVPLPDENGGVLGLCGITRDITRQKLVEKAIKESERRIKTILESVQAGIVIVDVETRKIVDVNRTALNLIGSEKENVIGKVCHHFICPADAGKCPVCDLNQKVDNSEKVLLTIDSESIPILKNVVKVKLDGHERCVESFIDIRQLKETEKALSQAQKLESIGQLAAGIAHEINTPTQYIGDNTRFLKEAFKDLNRFITKYNLLKQQCNDNSAAHFIRDLDDFSAEIDLDYLKEEIPKSIDETLGGIEGVAKIVRSMKEFSHPGIKEKTFIDLNHAIDSTITVSSNEWKYVAEMETDFDSALPMVDCLPGEINQVILNIIINAAHAIGDVLGENSAEKGRIKVKTLHRKDWAEIRISDSGSGIPKDVQTKIFDPFFTTKAIGKGTGQGLAIAHDIIVNKHNGTISFETIEGEGTTFIIRLPATKPGEVAVKSDQVMMEN